MKKIGLKVETMPTMDVTVRNPKTREKEIEKREISEVNQGEHTAFFEENGFVETTSREFADFLIHSYGLKEIEDEESDQDSGEKADDGKVDFLVGYPADFPHKEDLAAAETPYQTVLGLNREQLEELPKIGKKKAEDILQFIAGNDGNGGQE